MAKVSALSAKLDTIKQRLLDAKTALTARGEVGDSWSDLSAFTERHEAILQSLEVASAEDDPVHRQAASAADELESGLKSWMKSLDDDFGKPAHRNPSVSM